MNKSKPQGFTLIELLVTVAMLAIVLSTGVPSFSKMINSNQMTAQSNDFLAALTLARSEAIKRGVRVTVCKSADQATCVAEGGWSQGWIVFVDSNNNAARDDVDSGGVLLPLLRAHSALQGATLTGAGNVANYVSYVGLGSAQLTNGTALSSDGSDAFQLCPASGTNQAGRSIVINAIGHASVNKNVCGS
jgi:type IV fimbrial biogenesis protein FimT